MMNTTQNLTSREFDKYGMVVLNDHVTMPIEILQFNQVYQRKVENARLLNITDSIKKYGYWPFEVIILNEKNEIVDGQHRVKAAQSIGINDIPACVVAFPNKELEARFFVDKNNYNTKLDPINYWHARYLAEHPVANIIYELEEDPDSLLCDKIAIKGKQTRSNKFNIPDVLIIINTAVLGQKGRTWKRGPEDEILTTRLQKLGYGDILERVNDFCNWFYGCFGKNKSDNAIPFQSKNLRSLLVLYGMLKEQGFLETSSGLKSTINKMKKYLFAADFLRNDHAGQVSALTSHINKGRSKNKLKYNLF